MKLLNCKSLFPILYIEKVYTLYRLYGESVMFWFLSISFGPKYFLKMNN